MTSPWSHILTAPEIEAYFDLTTRLDRNFAVEHRAFFDRATDDQLRASMRGAWFANNPDGYQLARSFLNARDIVAA